MWHSNLQQAQRSWDLLMTNYFSSHKSSTSLRTTTVRSSETSKRKLEACKSLNSRYANKFKTFRLLVVAAENLNNSRVLPAKHHLIRAQVRRFQIIKVSKSRSMLWAKLSHSSWRALWSRVACPCKRGHLVGRSCPSGTTILKVSKLHQRKRADSSGVTSSHY